jgi:hypothetical protein
MKRFDWNSDKDRPLKKTKINFEEVAWTLENNNLFDHRRNTHMHGTTLLRIGAVLLVLWGLMNLIGGIVGSLDHPSGLVLPLFAITGVLITLAGIGFWLKKKWSVTIALIGLLGLSLTALYSASALRGWSGIQIPHHLTRLIISAVVFLTAFLGKRRASW